MVPPNRRQPALSSINSHHVYTPPPTLSGSSINDQILPISISSGFEPPLQPSDPGFSTGIGDAINRGSEGFADILGLRLHEGLVGFEDELDFFNDEVDAGLEELEAEMKLERPEPIQVLDILSFCPSISVVLSPNQSRI